MPFELSQSVRDDAATYRDFLGAAAAGAVGTADPSLCQGRLTTETGVAVSGSDRAAQSTLYFTPCGGNLVTLYSGSAWATFTLAEKSKALSGLTSGKNYDVFLYDSSGTLTLELSAAWSDDNTPTDAIVLQDGVPVKSGATTRRWLGTIRTTGTTTTEDSEGKRFVWNLYNQVSRKFAKREVDESHTYNTAVTQNFNASATGTLSAFVSGQTQMVQWFVSGKCGTTSPATMTNAVLSMAINGVDIDSPVVQVYGDSGANAHYLHGTVPRDQLCLAGYNTLIARETGYGTANQFQNGETFGTFLG